MPRDLKQFAHQLMSLIKLSNSVSGITVEESPYKTTLKYRTLMMRRDLLRYLTTPNQLKSRMFKATKIHAGLATSEDAVVAIAYETDKIGIHYNLHFDAFRKILLEHNLVLKKVSAWNVSHLNHAKKMIEKWGVEFKQQGTSNQKSSYTYAENSVQTNRDGSNELEQATTWFNSLSSRYQQ